MRASKGWRVKWRYARNRRSPHNKHTAQKAHWRGAASVQWGAGLSKIWLDPDNIKEPPMTLGTKSHRRGLTCPTGRNTSSLGCHFVGEKVFQDFWGREMNPTFTRAQRYGPEGLHGEASRICTFTWMYRYVTTFLCFSGMRACSSHLILKKLIPEIVNQW